MYIENINNQEYNAAIYIRLSKEDGDKEESESVVNQRKILRAYAKDKKIKIYDEYVDDGYSGTNFNRPSFKRMIEDLENKKINMVITKSLSRLGRDYIETGRYIETYFPEHGVRYVAILDDVDTFLDNTCDTVAFKNIMNDFYAKETSKNIKKTKSRKRQEGFFYVTYAPFGYKKVDKAGNLAIDELQAEVVRDIFGMFIEGKGTYQIARILSERNINSPGLQMNMPNVVNNQTNTTNKWHHYTIRRMLENQIYIGNCIQNKRKKISYKSKKLLTVPAQQHIITYEHHEPIISKEKWDTVQKMLKIHKNEKIRENDSLFKGLLYCSHCNNKLAIRTRSYKTKDGEKIRKYIACNNAEKKYTNKPCYPRYIKYEEFEEKALEHIQNILTTYIKSGAYKDEKALKKIMESQSTKGVLINKQNGLKQDLDKINNKLKTLYNDKLNGLIEDQDYTLFSKNFIDERKRIENLINNMQIEIDSFNYKDEKNKIQSDVQKMIKKLIKSKNYTKDILSQFINKIEIDKDYNATIYFNFYELNCIGGILSVKEQ